METLIARLNETRGALRAAAKAARHLQPSQSGILPAMIEDLDKAADLIATNWIPAIRNDEVVF